MTARVDIVTRSRKLSVMGLLLAGGALGAAGCAQQKTEGYYDPPVESTVTDAQYQGSGAGYRSVIRAPSQVQIALKPDARKPQNQAAQASAEAPTTEDGQPVPEGANNAGAASASAPAPAPANAAAQSLVPQPQTYMGTLPCFSPAMQCTAQRVTLTLAPNGRWRGRTAYLDDDPKKGPAVTEQGCWDATDERPPRVILMDANGNVRVEFLVAANNVLRVRSIGGQTPNLNYNLTRQPDLDPIDELAKAAAPKCP
ncbi:MULTISPECIES: copper resistance protein NlpE N-terminal domain-containing protein [Achromobacter]|uniref:Copper resistance protein NlpE N-terminal domain-containing protein n=1 Tax=Achromobacter spanius TaxID=217203 RepID=A0ABY8GQZ4_9BURK|nr:MULTISPECIES: copper resistance protein NlpE N-terminal domain-containing protein [Achromobacter]WAI83701.1 copper resistance protein NlpE [Achromobacter spanius]WEX93783.1 copper resistance protein NlpE [Achromobacter sp. SS2-2022]WFP07055.1 copper resistance protein NlpE N-terminal domain-containing protein [Achromobacter spanius]